jgi:hypothetical protein
LYNCDQNTSENNLKEEEFILLAVSEGLVHGYLASGVWEGQDCSPHGEQEAQSEEWIGDQV